MSDDRDLTQDEMDAAGIASNDPTRVYPVRLSHLSAWETMQVRLMDAPARYFVYWTDYVANQWAEVVDGTDFATRTQLKHLALVGKDDFGMTIIQIPTDTIQPTMTAEQFFALDWAEWLG